MKKRILCCVVSVLLLLTAAPIYALESDTPLTKPEIQVYDDGSYAIIETTTDEPNISTFASNTKSGKRVYTYYNKNDVREWDFTVKGTFSYNGTSAKATAVSTSYNIYRSGWRCSSRNSSKSGAKVSATATFKYNLLTKTITIGLKCSPNGTISAA